MSLIDSASLPPIPPSDTLYSKADGIYYTYGPRVTHTDTADGTEVVCPPEGGEPEFYGIYKHDPEASEWQWVADVDTLAEVHEYFEKL